MLIRNALVADASAIARLNVDTWRSSYCGLVPEEYLAGLSYGVKENAFRELLLNQQNGTFGLVAETAGEIVGHLFAGPEREGNQNYRAEIFAIYVSKEHQSQGIGLVLMKESFHILRQAGHDSVMLWTPAASPYQGFYKKLGGTVIGRNKFPLTEGMILDLVGYGWKDLDLTSV
ncbi:MAG: N-acetyltransferase family protein [Candidatus Saccharibacteria bacterium]